MVRSKSRNKNRISSTIDFFKVVNRFIRNGKKDLAYRCFLQATFSYKKLYNQTFITIYTQIVSVLRPLLHLKPLFSSGIVYHIPYVIDITKEYTLAISWFYRAVSARKERNLQLKIFSELIEIKSGKSPSIQLKLDYYKQIVTNRVFLFRFRHRFRFI